MAQAFQKARLACHLNGTVVVAVVTVRVVEVITYQVVGVVAVGDGLMAAPRAVLVVWVVLGRMIGGAPLRVSLAHLQRVLLDAAVLKDVVEVAVVEVVGVALVAYRRVAAARAVCVVVSGVDPVGHLQTPFLSPRVYFHTDHPTLRLISVSEDAEDQIHDVAIRQRVEDVFALPPADDQILPAQHPQPLRHRRKPLAGDGRYFGNAHLTPRKKLQKPQAPNVTNRPKHPLRTLKGGVAKGSLPPAMPGVLIVAIVREPLLWSVRWSVHHFIK